VLPGAVVPSKRKLRRRRARRRRSTCTTLAGVGQLAALAGDVLAEPVARGLIGAGGLVGSGRVGAVAAALCQHPDGCERPVRALGLCCNHYKRAYRRRNGGTDAPRAPGACNSNNQTSGVRGVSFDASRGKWVAYFQRRRIGGYYDSLEEAAAAVAAFRDSRNPSQTAAFPTGIGVGQFVGAGRLVAAAASIRTEPAMSPPPAEPRPPIDWDRALAHLAQMFRDLGYEEDWKPLKSTRKPPETATEEIPKKHGTRKSISAQFPGVTVNFDPFNFVYRIRVTTGGETHDLGMFKKRDEGVNAARSWLDRTPRSRCDSPSI
jgi:AP2 domain